MCEDSGIAVAAIANDMSNGIGTIAGIAVNSVLGGTSITIPEVPEEAGRRIAESRTRISEEELAIGATGDIGDRIVKRAGSEEAEH